VLRCVAVCCSVLQCVETCCNVSQSVSLGVYRHPMCRRAMCRRAMCRRVFHWVFTGVSLGVYRHQLRHPCFLLCFLPVPLQCLYLPPSSLQRHCVCVCVCVSCLDMRARSSYGCQKGSRRIQNYSEVRQAHCQVRVLPLESYSHPTRRSAVASPVAAMCRVSCSHTQGAFIRGEARNQAPHKDLFLPFPVHPPADPPPPQKKLTKRPLKPPHQTRATLPPDPPPPQPRKKQTFFCGEGESAGKGNLGARRLWWETESGRQVGLREPGI